MFAMTSGFSELLRAGSELRKFAFACFMTGQCGRASVLSESLLASCHQLPRLPAKLELQSPNSKTDVILGWKARNVHGLG